MSQKSELLNPSLSSNSVTIGTGCITHTPNNLWTDAVAYNYPITPWISIDKVENGFILKKEGKTYVCKTEKDIIELLKETK